MMCWKPDCYEPVHTHKHNKEGEITHMSHYNKEYCSCQSQQKDWEMKKCGCVYCTECDGQIAECVG